MISYWPEAGAVEPGFSPEVGLLAIFVSLVPHLRSVMKGVARNISVFATMAKISLTLAIFLWRKFAERQG